MGEGRPRLAARLSRRTSGGRYLPELDGVRFLAIAIVLAVHVFAVSGLSSGSFEVVQPFGPVLARSSNDVGDLWLLLYGHIGVYLFFVLSGFVLAVPFIRSRVMQQTPVSLPRYFVRRVTRIEPPFLAMSFGLLALSTALHRGPSASHFISTLSYAHQGTYGDLSPLDGVFWSLEAEVQWYLIVPVLALILCRGRSRQRLLQIATLIGGALIVEQALGPVVLSRIALLENLPFFLIGWLLADVHTTRFRETSLDSQSLDVVAIACLPLLMIAFRFHPPSWRLTLPPLCGLVVAGALHGRMLRRLLSLRWIAIVGGMCYSIYLIHYPVLILGGEVLRSARPVNGLLLGSSLAFLVALALLLSGFFFAFVERPCMDPAWPDHVRAWTTRHKSRGRDRQIIVEPTETDRLPGAVAPTP